MHVLWNTCRHGSIPAPSAPHSSRQIVHVRSRSDDCPAPPSVSALSSVCVQRVRCVRRRCA
eukprot:696185-Rhodomonas_salina.1